MSGKKNKTYIVTVTRNTTTAHDFKVEAKSWAEAEEKALELAPDHEWTVGGADYDVSGHARLIAEATRH